MGAKQTSGRQEAPPATLGDLLYSDRTAPVISEEEWVLLVRSIGAGDQRALRALYERTHRLVFTLAMRITSVRELAEEITVDVFHDVWRASAKYDPEGGPVLGWIMNQARSRAIDRLRFEQRKKRTPQRAAAGGGEPVVEGHPGEAVDARRRRRSLHQALTALTPDERRTIETAFFGELTYSETAAHLG